MSCHNCLGWTVWGHYQSLFKLLNLNLRNKNNNKKFQDNKNRGFEKAKEEIKETIEALCKHQSETENTINKQINELRTKIDNIKEKTTQDMEKPQKK
jgi:uncharacterized protein Yka (UPF0111/DUF47 family)